MPTFRDIADAVPKAIEAVYAVFDSSKFPKSWKVYFLSQIGVELQTEAIKERLKKQSE